MFCSFAGLAQTDSLNFVDNNGWKQGRWKKFHPTGYKRYVGQFKDNKPVGTFYYFDDLGKKLSTLIYKNDTAFATYFHLNGKIMAEGKYYNQKKHGLWKYYDNLEVLSSTENYNLGTLHGKRIVYFSNGNPAKTEYYTNGLQNGKVKEYFDNGNLKYKANHVDGNPDSLVVFYYPDGKIKREGKYKFAVKHGKWSFYDEQGVITHWEFYDIGQLKKVLKREELDE